MNVLAKDISSIGLQIKTFGQFVRLTKGQFALLQAMRNCVKNGTAISWDLLVDIYYKNVSSRINDYRYLGRDETGHANYEYFYVDVMEVYHLQNSKWQYTLRPRIRQWFVSTIGILVIKNQLIVIPTIDIEEQ